MTPEGYYVDAGLDMGFFLDHQAGTNSKKLAIIKNAIQERIDDYYQKNKIISKRQWLLYQEEDPLISPEGCNEEDAYRRIYEHAERNPEYDLFLDDVMYSLRSEDASDEEYYYNIGVLEDQLHLSELAYIRLFQDMVLERLKEAGDYPKEQSFQGFTTTMTENQVRYLYNALKEKRYVASDTTEAVFFSVFQPIDYNQEKIAPQKIVWKGQINQCTYLIDRLLRHNYMNDTKIQWKITRSCIELESYGNLARILSKFKAEPTSAAKPIDEILDALATVK